MLKGVDLSHWQSTFNNFNDVDFAFIKATEGVGYVDPACDTLYQRAKNSGKLLGVYHYARPDLGNSAISEADWFIDNIKGYLNESILALDWEEGYLGNVEWAKAFLDRVKERTGIKGLIYMSASPMREYDWSSVSNADYGLWVANYGKNNGQPQENVFNNYPLKYWSFYALWQYTSKGRVNGYNGDVDMNYFSGDAEAWRKYANANSQPKPIPTPTPSKKTNEEIANEVLEGKWGNQPERQQKLEAAGYNYQEVQDIVNAKLGINTNKTLSVGTKVKTIKTGNGASDGFSNRARSGMTGTITRIIEGANYPYLVSNGSPIGWYKAEALQII